MKEDFLFLKDKAEKFMEMADFAFRQKHYDLTALNLEQAAQLYLKFSIATVIGDFPHIHHIEELLNTAGKTIKEFNAAKLLEEEQEVINDLSKSYFDSRYFDKPFTCSQVEKMKNFVILLKNLLHA